MRLALLITAVLLSLGLVACGGGDESEAVPAETSSEAPASDESVDAESGEQAPADTVAPQESDAPASPTDGELVTCELETYPSQVPLEGGIVHVGQLPDGFSYNSTPASQGPHDADWLGWGIYEEPVPELNVVHNLEHGGITVQYGLDVSADTVAQITSWYLEDPNAVIVAPYNGLGTDIALAAWTVEDIDQGADAVYRSSQGNVLRCTGFDARAFSEFREGFRGRAPERIPLDRMPPGS